LTSFTRANLLTNPSFETNTTGWSTVNGETLSSSATQAWTGTKSQKVVYDGTARAADQTGTSVASYGFTNLTQYTFSAYVWVPTGQPAVKIKFGGPNYNVTGTTSTTHDQWERLSVTTTATGTNAAWLYILNAATSVANGIGFYVDGAMLEMASAPSTYFDGSTAASGAYTYAWTGTANASTSNESVSGRINNVTNPSCETDTTGWATVNGETLSSSATQAWVGTKSQKVVYDGSTRAAGQTGTAVASYPFVSGVSYTFSAYVWVPTGQPAVKIKYGGPTFDVTGSTTTTHDQWERISVTTTAGSTGVAWLYILNAATSVPNAIGFYVDGAMMENSGTLGAYFSGATVQSGYTYAWTGTANASTSTERIAIASALSGSGTLTSGFTNYRRISSGLSGSGTLTASLHRYITSTLSGSGTLTSPFTDYQNIDSQLSGSGSLTSAIGRFIHSDFSGSGTLGAHFTDYLEIASALSGSGTLTSGLHRYIQSALAGSGTLTAAFTNYREIASALSGSGTLTSDLVAGNVLASSFSGQGWLSSTLAYSPRFTSHLGGEGVLRSTLSYVFRPAPLGTEPLGKLARFSVNTSAVPLNPAEGSGSTPSVSASYTKGLDPEFMLGETNVLTNGAIGTYEGEVVKLTLAEASGLAAVSMNTPLTLLNNELHLFPFIDGVPGLWTAARAIDYWTQQCGLFYDKVPGDCIAYASGFGHTDSYGASTTHRFYEKLTGGTTSTTVLNDRSVRTMGSAVTGTTALHEVKNGTVTASLPLGKKMVFSIGLGLLGTGRTSTVTWSFLDNARTPHTVSLSATSAGGITAKIGVVTVASASVPAGEKYRLALSLEKVSGTALETKLTVHTDDLAGNGTLEHDGTPAVVSYTLPSVLNLTAISHASAGGSGAQMVRWGTYLTVADAHPMELPAVQKVLEETTKDFAFVSGFEGNVWNLMAEFCSIARLDARFVDRQLQVAPRTATLSLPGISFARFENNWERRDKYKQVALMNKQSKAVTTDDGVFWKADSVFSVAAREVFETTIQTGHSILNLVQPVPVLGIEPFPYLAGGGQYVVTGADGYIIAPEWWNDNGGKLEVSLTGKEGEIAIKITAPTQDTVRAPYRISEGAADRPALYICGSGIVNDPVEVHVGTGARNAKEGFENVFESPFLASVRETYNTAAAMAHQYSASHAETSFELPNSFETPTGFGQFPSGTLFTDNARNYRVMDTSQTHSRVSGNAVPHTTIGAYVASYPAGSTIADEKARHAGRTIRKFNIKPLKGA